MLHSSIFSALSEAVIRAALCRFSSAGFRSWCSAGFRSSWSMYKVAASLVLSIDKMPPSIRLRPSCRRAVKKKEKKCFQKKPQGVTTKKIQSEWGGLVKNAPNHTTENMSKFKMQKNNSQVFGAIFSVPAPKVG